jgi:hypothetical protein
VSVHTDDDDDNNQLGQCGIMWLYYDPLLEKSRAEVDKSTAYQLAQRAIQF